ncbi:hypothetical protein P8452_51414 [Trifolium repens]|nr:hypothetical protein P8452_51414 [Trifolium repens]
MTLFQARSNTTSQIFVHMLRKGVSEARILVMVDPSDIRKLQKSFGEAIAKHMGNSNPNINKWKMSLQQVASLSGFHYKKGEMYEHEFIGKIVEEVLKKITVEDMGKDIVKQESPNPWERSRLWDSKDINEVLKENKETSKIGIIYVNESIKVEQDGEAFNKMKNLKTLLIDKLAYVSGSLKHLPNSLRVLDCRSYCKTKVVFPNKKFQNMRVLNFDHPMVELLQIIHALSKCPNLEELSIQKCWGKFTSDESVGFWSNLKILRIIRCRQIKSVPPLNCPSLVELDLSNCSSLESFPSTVNGFAGNLKILRLEGKSKLLNEKLHEAENTWFSLPHAKIPEWFDHQCSAGSSICFWFRNKFPAIVLGVVSTLSWSDYHHYPVTVIINGNKFFYPPPEPEEVDVQDKKQENVGMHEAQSEPEEDAQE